MNIDNYFSGCLTLTIEKFANIKRNDYIVLVGLKDEEIEYIKFKTTRPIKVINQDVPYGSFTNESWDDRRKRVIDLLKLYQGAHMVITNKLHCSLPCLALEVPVLLLYDKSFPENKDRIGTYLEYLNYINREELKSKSIDYENPKSNPTKYLELRKKLIKKCSDFIKQSSNISVDNLPEIDFYKEYIKRAINSRMPIIKHLNVLSKKYVEECKKASMMYDEINELKFKNECLIKEKEDLNKKFDSLNVSYDEIRQRYNVLSKRMCRIENSRSYKLYKKIKKIC